VDDPENKPEASPTRGPDGRLLPGHTGNKGGRPKGVAEFREWLSEDDPNQKQSRRHALRQRLYDLAFDDDRKVAAKAVELILAYDMGRPPQRIEDSDGRLVPSGLIFFPAKTPVDDG
jgi:hypothetical protein